MTGAIGVVAGVVIGIVGIVVVNSISPTIAVGGGAQQGLGGQGGFAGPGGMSAPGGMGDFAQAAAGVTLNAVVTPSVILIAVGLALLGAVLAGVFGGWRAARLRPAAALRTVE